jgi:hypothetical protein
MEINWCSIHNRKYYKKCPECLREVEIKNLDNLIDDKPKEDRLPDNTKVKETDDYILSICPDCHKPSFHYNKHTKESECFNKSCPSNGLSKFLTRNT